VKLILTRDMPGLGAPGDIVEVRDGYGRNFLVPRGLAVNWTRGAQSQVGTIRRSREVREVRDLGQAREMAAALAALHVRLERRAGQGGRLFGSVTAGDIADAVQQSGGPAIDKRRIDIPAAIKTVGEHRLQVRLHPDVSAALTVEVVAAG
jgi:large subunit ribosomal protein L9